MNEGMVIKYYREKAGLTQEQLGKGICSITHVSKIERGLTQYSPNITDLICQRLGIDFENEIQNFKNAKKQLDLWHEAIIMEELEDVEVMKNELKRNPFVHISGFEIMYRLLEIRYYLLKINLEKAEQLLKKIQTKNLFFSKYEQNLFKHILGMYYIRKSNLIKAIKVLKDIEQEEYNNQEYFYHLAIAYSGTNYKVLAYHYAEKSLQFFKKTNNFRLVIDAESLMLGQLGSDEIQDFDGVSQQYKTLIKRCDVCNTPHKKAKLLHNLAVKYFEKKEYVNANKSFLEAMSLKNMNTLSYLSSLSGHIRSCLEEGNLLPRNDLFTLIEDGRKLADKLNDECYQIIFTLLLYFIENRKEDYYHYLYSVGIPIFKRNGDVFSTQYFQKDLFKYYLKVGNQEAALKIATSLVFNK
ncbi:helix-turn-helix transcriptional regulator [Cytobacillus firmus]|uniref:helix-turn-helix domain-containing protein n=1 Tax=Cytobacillus firmus TaxID=1399 RepID=UPI001C8D082C|nr:helix-turn-helix transcriptional regulator [Cytobacillus firmus]MBX9975073.1 helix-turn-helix domain-containing protein [Cytobacillus firmus]